MAKRTSSLGRSVREHRRAFRKALNTAQTFEERASKDGDCRERLLWYRDAWMKAGEAQTHLVDGKAFAKPKAGRKGVYESEWTSEERHLNSLMRRLDRATASITKSCLRRPRKRR